MSLLMFAHNDDDAYVLTDTLATTENGEPFLFVDKCLPVPSMNLLIATTGYGQLLVRWMEAIRGQMLARDITMLDLHTPEHLRTIWADLNEEHGDLQGTGTIYHFGIDERTGRCERYTYRSANNFESERADEGGFGIKPPPLSGTVEVPDDWVTLAQAIRAEQGAQPRPERVYIGGDLMLAHISKHRCEISRIYRFPDQYDAWQAMNGEAPAGVEAVF